tara:strand:- start:2938 stop:3972 length:1035 start_codon:yes stop_codon:yes gene_type:complete
MQPADFNIEDYITGLPKAELHLHIEGTLEPEMMLTLAGRNGVNLPYKTLDEIRAAYRFDCLQDFLDVYYAGMSVLQTEQDFHDLTFAYLQRAHADNVIHCEIFFDPQGHTDRGIAFDVALNGICSALDRAEAAFGLTSQLIMCFLRHLPEKAAFETLEQAQPYRNRIVGVGLDSSELGHPPAKFRRVFAEAARQGYRLVAHCGEEGPAEYVRDGLDLLKIDRIDHGNRALDDRELTARIAREGIALTVCPLSNLRLQVVTDMKDHPVRQMLDAGLKATINSDDPAYFGGYMTENYLALSRALKLTRSEIDQLAQNAMEAGFQSDDRRLACLAALDNYRSAHPVA